MKKRIIAAFAAAIFICSLFASVAMMYPNAAEVRRCLDTSPEGITDWERVIAYVPLDDRVDNVETVIYMAEAAGYKLVMPEAADYATRLDGQGIGGDRNGSGSREALFQWVRKMDGAGCNIFILSLDQLMSGGLVNSRAMTENAPLSFEGGTQMTETEAFDSYIMPLCADEDNSVYLFDSIMRLASSTGYNGLGYRQYVKLRNYGKIARCELSGDNLTVENVIEKYPYGANGQTFAWRAMENGGAETKPTNSDIAAYLAARARKLRLLDYELSAMATLSGDNVRMLVGIDDSSAGENIQTNEMRYVQANKPDSVTLLPGMDSLARVLLGLIFAEKLGGIDAWAGFFGGSEYLPATMYDHVSLVNTLRAHLELYNIGLTNENNADIEILLLTKPFNSASAKSVCQGLAEKLKYNQENGMPTILVDVSGGWYGDTLWKEIFESADLAGLMGYAGRYDLASATGAGLAMGISRFACLSGGESGNEQNVAHVSQLANSLAISYAYMENAYADVTEYVTYRGYDYLNMYRHIPVRRWDGMLIYQRLDDSFSRSCRPLCQNMSQGSVITGLAPLTIDGVDSVAFRSAAFPWNRTSEITFNIDVKLKTQ